MMFKKIKRIILGKPLSSQMEIHERLPKWQALAVLASDALSSIAYATEEILIPLAVFSTMAMSWSLPICFGILILLCVLTLSYCQTVDAYPQGGGSYIVAKENLGVYAGLVAGASLLIDYILTVAVSIAAGVENIVSAFPVFLGHQELLGSFFIIIIMFLNLRGSRESAQIFTWPTYFFLASIVLLLVVGWIKFLLGHGPHVSIFTKSNESWVPLFLILKAFSSGCAALTGVEAISNGIPLFQPPEQRNAKITLICMSFILGLLFLGMTLLAHVYGIVPQKGETVISMLGHAVLGNGVLYYVLQVATALILILAANTSYADFPRLSSLLAKDRFLPRQLGSLGDRLVFSNGIIGLSLSAILLIIVFHGETHHLIPLYAVGVFLSFTLSQLGMVIHHLRTRSRKWCISLFFNFLGACFTMIVLLVIAFTKFLAGAWMVIFMIPLLVFIFHRIHAHYLAVGRELSLIGMEPRVLTPVRHVVILPISGIHRGVIKALRYALSIASDVRACYVEVDAVTTQKLQLEWSRWAGSIPMIVLKSPYRSVITPLIDYLDEIDQTRSFEMVTVVIPEFITFKWWHQILHNQTALIIRAALMFKRRKVVTSVRYHLDETD